MISNISRVALLSLGLALATTLPNAAEAITFNFNWRGQIAGLRVKGQFSYDENQSFVDGIVRTSDLEALDVSFLAPDGTLLIAYNDNHLDPEVNFNFDTETLEILQAGTYFDPDGINIGDGLRSTGLTFWSKPPQSSTPHVHFDDWLNIFGFTPGFDPHEDVAFPSRTTQELVDTGRVLIDPVTSPNRTGRFARVTPVPEPSSLLGLFAIIFGVLGTVFNCNSADKTNN